MYMYCMYVAAVLLIGLHFHNLIFLEHLAFWHLQILSYNVVQYF